MTKLCAARRDETDETGKNRRRRRLRFRERKRDRTLSGHRL